MALEGQNTSFKLAVRRSQVLRPLDEALLRVQVLQSRGLLVLDISLWLIVYNDLCIPNFGSTKHPSTSDSARQVTRRLAHQNHFAAVRFRTQQAAHFR